MARCPLQESAISVQGYAVPGFPLLSLSLSPQPQDGGWEDRQTCMTRCPFHKYTAILMASRHSRESGNPGGESHGDWMPAYAGMTFYWYRTYEMDI